VATPRGTPPPVRTSPYNMAIDEKGKALPFTPAEVTEVSRKALEHGDVLAAVIELPSGDLAVQVYGPPSRKLVDVLETTLHAYKTALKGH
jgi:hypothetical protein